MISKFDIQIREDLQINLLNNINGWKYTSVVRVARNSLWLVCSRLWLVCSFSNDPYWKPNFFG